MVDGIPDIGVLFVLNIALYGAALGGYLRNRRLSYRPTDPAKAFALLERSMKNAFPDLPEGFTWREALARLKITGIRGDWLEITRALRQYEYWRYGEMVKPDEVNPEVVRLAKQLSKRGRKWLPT